MTTKIIIAKIITIEILPNTLFTLKYKLPKKKPIAISIPDQMICPTALIVINFQKLILDIPAVKRTAKAKPNPLLILEKKSSLFLCL